MEGESRNSAISSPVFADGKIFLVIGGGSKIVMLKPSPEKRIELGKANARAVGSLAGHRRRQALVRGPKGISCYNLTAAAMAARP